MPSAAIDQRHDPERPPEGVHRPRHVRLPAAAVDAADHRHLRLLPRARPEVEHDLDLRLPHPRGGLDGGAGDRLHASPNGIAYVQAAIDAGLDVDEFAPRLSFFWNAHNNFFEEVAKYRAARRMWYRIMTERFGAKKEASKLLRFHTQTGGSTLTAQQPENNVVRVAVQALAAVLGGTQSLHTNGFDEALGLPDRAGGDASRCARSRSSATSPGVVDTPDPLGGLVLRRVAHRRGRGAGVGVHRPHRRRWAARWPPSRPATRRTRSSRRPTSTRSRSTTASASSSASTASSSRRRGRARGLPDRSRAAARARSSGVEASGRRPRPGGGRRRRSTTCEAAARGTQNLLPPMRAALARPRDARRGQRRPREVFGEYRPSR